MKHNVIIALLALLLASCEKTTQDNLIPPDAARLSELQQQYADLLIASEAGWYMEYAATEENGAISIWLRFFEDGKVTMQSDLYNFTEERTSTFRVGGINRPELVFDTYSVLSVMAERMGGAFEFYLQPREDGTMALKPIVANAEHEYTLRPALPTDKELIAAKTQTSQLLSAFNENASAYFKNLILEQISAFCEIDVAAQVITFTWANDQQEVVTQAFSYTNLANGIKLAGTWRAGNVSINELHFGTATANELEVVDAGEAGSGQIAVSHVPAFPYNGAADLFIWAGSDVTVRFFAYTSDDVENHYSASLIDDYAVLKAALGAELLRVQLYNNNPAGSGSNSLQLLTRLPGSDSNVWLPYYYALEKLDESHVIVTPTGVTNTNGAPYLADALRFMENLFPPEGVTVVPYGRSGTQQRLRLVSRKDSRYHITVNVSTPSGVYID